MLIYVDEGCRGAIDKMDIPRWRFVCAASEKVGKQAQEKVVRRKYILMERSTRHATKGM